MLSSLLGLLKNFYNRFLQLYVISITYFCVSAAMTTCGFADNFRIDNQTLYPAKNQLSRIAIEWAVTAREVEEGNQAIIYRKAPNRDKLRLLNCQGVSEITIPEKAQYFRVLAWSSIDGHEPDFVTNWVDIVPDKTYILKQEHLISIRLATGIGC